MARSLVYGKTPPGAKVIIKGVYKINTTLFLSQSGSGPQPVNGSFMPPALFENA